MPCRWPFVPQMPRSIPFCYKVKWKKVTWLVRSSEENKDKDFPVLLTPHLVDPVSLHLANSSTPPTTCSPSFPSLPRLDCSQTLLPKYDDGLVKRSVSRCALSVQVAHSFSILCFKVL